MKTPIIVCENGDIDIFQTKEDAERYIEPVDVENGEFLVFDSDGNTIDLEVVEERAKGLFGFLGGKIKKVKVKSERFIPENADILRAQLINFLLNRPSIELSNSVSINELVEKIKKGP